MSQKKVTGVTKDTLCISWQSSSGDVRMDRWTERLTLKPLDILQSNQAAIPINIRIMRRNQSDWGRKLELPLRVPLF